MATMMGAQQGIKKETIFGFDGFNIPTPQMPLSVFYGKKKLIISIGPDATEKTLSALNNPGEGEALLVNNKNYQNFITTEKLVDSTMFSYGDLSNTGTLIYDLITTLIQQPGSTTVDQKVTKVFDQLKPFMPERKDFEGIFGISYSVVIPSDEGVVIESKLTLP